MGKKLILRLLIAVFFAGYSVSICTAQTSNATDSVFNDIVVTGVKTEIKRTNVTENTWIIDSTDIRALKAATIEQILATVPGLAISKVMTGTQVCINGLPGQYTKLLIDGVPVIDGEQTGGLNLENIPVNDIERIEIVKGSGSTLYGSDALGGVINIITGKNRGSHTASLQLRANYLSNICSSKWNNPGFSMISPVNNDYDNWAGVFNGSVSLSHNNSLFGIKADAGCYADGGAVNTIENRPLGERPYYSIPGEWKKNLKLGITTDKAYVNMLKASLGYSNNKSESSLDEIQKLTLKTRRLDMSIKADHKINSVIMVSGYITAQHHFHERVRYNFDYRKISEKEITEFPKVEYEMVSSFKTGVSQKLTIGVNGGYEAVDADYIIGGGKSGTQVALFTQDVINIKNKDIIIITPGLRYYWNSRFTGAVTPNIGLRLNLIKPFFIKMAAGGGYKAPSFKDNYRDEWVHTGGTFVLSGNTELKPERSWSVNGATGGNIKKGISWEIGAHATKLVDKISTRLISNDTGTTARGEHFEAVRKYVNQDSAFTRGVDISLEYRLTDKLRIKASYAWLDSWFWNETGVRTESELYSPNTVKVSFFNQILLFKRWMPSVMFDIVWQSKQMDGASEDGIRSSYADINMAVELPLSDMFTFTLGGKNLIDNTIKEWNQITGRTLFAEIVLNVQDITKPFKNR